MENDSENLTAILPTWVILFTDSRRCCEVTAEKNGLVGFRLVFVHVSTPFSTKTGPRKRTLLEDGAERSRWSNQLDFGGQDCLVWVRYFLQFLLIQSFLLRNSGLFTVKSALFLLLTASLGLPWFSLQVEVEVVPANRRWMGPLNNIVAFYCDVDDAVTQNQTQCHQEHTQMLLRFLRLHNEMFG